LHAYIFLDMKKNMKANSNNSATKHKTWDAMGDPRTRPLRVTDANATENI